MAQRGAALPLTELLRRERRDLYPEQAIWLQVLPRVAQEGQRVVHAQEAQERVEGADGEAVAPSERHVAHIAPDPLDVIALFAALLYHVL